MMRSQALWLSVGLAVLIASSGPGVATAADPLATPDQTLQLRACTNHTAALKGLQVANIQYGTAVTNLNGIKANPAHQSEQLAAEKAVQTAAAAVEAARRAVTASEVAYDTVTARLYAAHKPSVCSLNGPRTI